MKPDSIQVFPATRNGWHLGDTAIFPVIEDSFLLPYLQDAGKPA